MWELIDILRTHEPTDDEYKKAFVMYERLHSMEIDEQKLKAYKWGRITDILSTFGLAVIVLTNESWTPITSKWGNALYRPFSHKNDSLINFK